MAYSAFAVANAFIQRAKEKGFNLSPMKLQKLMYYAQVWHLKVANEPLLDDNFCRWKFGPVVPAVYHEFKDYGFRNIGSMATTLVDDGEGEGYSVIHPKIPQEDETSWGLIDAIVKRYGRVDAQSLSEMTHKDGSAWHVGLRDGVADGSVITHDQMRGENSL